VSISLCVGRRGPFDSSSLVCYAAGLSVMVFDRGRLLPGQGYCCETTKIFSCDLARGLDGCRRGVRDPGNSKKSTLLVCACADRKTVVEGLPVRNVVCCRFSIVQFSHIYSDLIGRVLVDA
jgi:hypothetical protein